MLPEDSDQIHCQNLLVKETPVTSKRTKTNWEMTPEKYYAVHLVSSVLLLTATTHFASCLRARINLFSSARAKTERESPSFFSFRKNIRC